MSWNAGEGNEMSSMLRRQQRKIMRENQTWVPAPQAFKMLPNGGYLALHPTKGWKRVGPARLRAFGRHAGR